MRFAHLSDSHLGYRQFGLLEREQDFYEVFARNIDKIIEQDVDFVIHSGDLFDSNRPSTEALLAFQKALLRLNEAKIPIYAIAGNHDSILRKNALPPQVLFKDIGLNVISDNNPIYAEGPVLICGIRYVPNSQSKALINAYNQLSSLADKYLKSILVSHQGIGKWMPYDTAEIELNDLPKNFDYYAMGHIHNYIEEDYGKGKLVYPGSMEIWKTRESNDNFREHGKGFCVVDLSYDKPVVERIAIDLPREFYTAMIDYNKFDEELHKLKEKIQSLDNKPMLDLTVYGGDFDSAEFYEIIQDNIGGKVLNLRPTFKPDKVLKDEADIDPDKTLDPRSLLYARVNEIYGREEVNKLSIDLLDNLSIGKIDDAKIISDVFYKEYYYDGDDDSQEDLDSNSNDEDSQNDLDNTSIVDDSQFELEDNSDENNKTKKISLDDF